MTATAVPPWRREGMGHYQAASAMLPVSPARGYRGPGGTGPEKKKDILSKKKKKYSMRITVGYGDPARGQVRKLLRAT